MSSGRTDVASSDLDWWRILDEYARTLDRQAVALADDDIDPAAVGSFEPPADLGPLPEALRPRASSLVARTQELVAVAQRLIDATTPAPTARPRPRRHTRSATFDQRA